MTMTLDQFREKYPQYNSVPDRELADRLHAKYYPNIPKPAFYRRIGLKGRGNAGSAVLQGLTFGWSDELGGVGSYLSDRLTAGATHEQAKRSARQTIESTRGDIQSYREDSPWLAYPLEIGSAMVSGGPLFRGATTGLKMLGLGMAEGGLAGAGAADENKALGGLVGAGLGGLFAGVVPAGGYVVRRSSSAINDNVLAPLRRRLASDPQTAAVRMTADALAADGVNPAALQAGYRRLGPDATLPDVAGERTMGLAQGVIGADRTGNALASARRAYQARARRSTQRMTDDINEIASGKTRLLDALDEVRARRRAQSGEAYAAAYSRDVPADDAELIGILNRPSVRDGMRAALRNAKDEGRELPVLEEIVMKGDDWTPQTTPFPDMRALDETKRALDRMVTSAFRTGDPRAVSLRTARNALRSKLDDINPEYKAARDVYAGDAALEDALLEGEGFLNRKTREVREYVRGLGDSEREAYLTGAIEAIRERMGRASTGQIREFNFLENNNAKAKLRMLFPEGKDGSRAFTRFMRMLQRERTFANTQGTLTGNSQTQLRQSATDAVRNEVQMPTSVEALRSPVAALANTGLQGARRAMSGLSQASMDELTRLLFTPGNADMVIAELQRRGVPQQEIARLVSRFAIGSATLSPAAGLLGGGAF